MKVVLPINGQRFASRDILPASCTSKPQVSCTSSANIPIRKGLSNQEIYEGIVNVKEHIISLICGNKTEKSVNYII